MDTKFLIIGFSIHFCFLLSAKTLELTLRYFITPVTSSVPLTQEMECIEKSHRVIFRVSEKNCIEMHIEWFFWVSKRIWLILTWIRQKNITHNKSFIFSVLFYLIKIFLEGFWTPSRFAKYEQINNIICKKASVSLQATPTIK